MAWLAALAFVKKIPIRILVVIVALMIGLFTVWLGYKSYTDLQNELVRVKHKLSITEIALETAKVTAAEHKRQLELQITSYTELERRRQATEDEWRKSLEQLNEISGDCNESFPTGQADPAVDALNRLNLDANRMLRQD